MDLAPTALPCWADSSLADLSLFSGTHQSLFFFWSFSDFLTTDWIKKYATYRSAASLLCVSEITFHPTIPTCSAMHCNVSYYLLYLLHLGEEENFTDTHQVDLSVSFARSRICTRESWVMLGSLCWQRPWASLESVNTAVLSQTVLPFSKLCALFMFHPLAVCLPTRFQAGILFAFTIAVYSRGKVLFRKQGSANACNWMKPSLSLHSGTLFPSCSVTQPIPAACCFQSSPASVPLNKVSEGDDLYFISRESACLH